MKATGVVRRIDELGRVVVPKEIRRSLGIETGDKDTAGDPIEFFVDGDKIILRKYVPGCAITGSVDDLVSFGGKQYSREVIRQLARVAGV